jgi:hypothetical protein
LVLDGELAVDEPADEIARRERPWDALEELGDGDPSRTARVAV